MKKIIFATGNEGKMREIREILSDLPYEILSMKEAGLVSDPEENGETFEENALIKARALHEALGDQVVDTIVMADDSGLEIDALPDVLGVKSARFMGHDTDYVIKNKRILEMMEGVAEEKRSARFVAAIAAVFPDGREVTKRGVMEGRIGYEISGNGGFGYDPIFFLPEFNKTSADITAEEKNAISHRGKALRMMKEEL
ncbi:MAG: RdgB/HAM1 family non-canonical purine NTP pyrophosphatase [Lachnospiraceae bacterium]|jgi:XTP/dITP diphosphohydrolase|nr:RdgB/HAM1 family non-canonical purine NTP pyrophosphatase [Lachnospiraceae bacterium]MCI7328663.1 RdgB/HAM1 family non-canonical purine NTP pyrophosphatase [Lachnospiraceae bacterium]MDD7702920.1 RdgB/HAM1 family non-canonical purine NTP pyrophosphatase [Lachnospiraceae bacterium]MDY3301654.1 RdgB/HAM1 family non-canonical purine NTP pyrophosphatase [Lachnospiraceae bacterium]MEE3379330.1 RdgB/HAM1 family non-canonical purine NTP pyrophosphatase [Lachnospiraceae bacterium]